MRSHRTTALLVVAGLLLGACGQPREPLTVGIREVPNDIVLGGGPTEEEPTEVAPPPLPPTPVVISAPVVVPPPAPQRFSPSPTPSPRPRPTVTVTATPTARPTVPPPPVEECPEDDPLDAPAFESRRDLAIPPALETLTYRNEGSFSVSGANANEGEFSGDTERTVTEVELDDDTEDFTFAVEAELAGSITTTTYRVVNTRPVAPVSPILETGNVNDTRGLYLVSTETVSPEGDESGFNPVPELMLLPFPSTVGDTFDAAGSDPLTGTSMSYTATVGDTVRINACGTPLQGIEVVLSNGTIRGTSQDVEFSARYVFATQYGGLAIEDEFNIAGTEAGVTSSRMNLSTINVVPTYGPDAPEPASDDPEPEPTETGSGR